jgi:predicted deacetylase
MAGKLIVSVSGIRSETRKDAEAFAALMDKRGVPLSLLVAPRQSDGYQLTRDTKTQHWLQARSAHGDAIVLHGFDQAATAKRRAEFVNLPQHEAKLRLMGADRLLEQAGLRATVFAGPRWLASEGTQQALPDLGFEVYAGMSGIRHLGPGSVIKSRVMGIGAGFRTEPWWCRALVLGAGRIARRDGVVRLSATAKQLGGSGPRAALLDAVDLAIHYGALPVTYGHAPIRHRDAA